MKCVCLHILFYSSGRRGSNPPPIAWKAIALPNELLPLNLQSIIKQAVTAILWWGQMDSNHRRHSPADLQSAPFGRSGISPFFWLSAKRFAEIVCKSTSFFYFCKHLTEKFLINFYNRIIPKLNPARLGLEFFSNNGLRS